MYQLSYEYDEEGLHELRHRELKRKLEVVKTFDAADLVKGDSANKDGTLTLKEDELIRKRPNGTFVMIKSNFDFLEKPKGFLESDEYLNPVVEEGEESKRAEVKVQHRSAKGKQPKSGKSQISTVFTTKIRENAIRKPKIGFV